MLPRRRRFRASDVELLVATRSRHKMSEIMTMLGDIPGLRLVDLDSAGVEPDPAEEGLEPYDTFEANARSKAEYFHAKSGLPTVADDSGLEVDALGGAPGVRSKRFAPDRGLDGQELDDANNQHLMERLEGVEPERRTGRYVCAAVLVGFPVGEGREPAEVVLRGEAEGLLLDQPRGTGGFGYDPYFFDPDLGQAFAEIHQDVKNARSHRGKAFGALAEWLTQRLAAPTHP